MNRAALCLSGLLAAGLASAQTTAITGATVHTVGPQGTIENATILIEGERISAVGAGLAVPDGAVRVDATGKIITPGLFSPLGAIGLSEVGAVTGTNDAIQRGAGFSAGFDVVEAYNPRSTVVAISRIDGITRAGLTPRAGTIDDGEPGHVLSGLGSVVHLGDGPGHVVRRGAVVVANLGETGSAVAGGSRAAAIQVVQGALDDAADYRVNRAAYERGDWRDYSVGRADLEALVSVLDGRAAMLMNVHRASDVSRAVALAGRYGIRVIIAGGAEAWMVADELAAADVPVILDGDNNLPVDFDRLNARLDAAAILAAAGVRIAFGAGVQTHNARLITQSAGNAVAHGLGYDLALAAITATPAGIWDIADRVGSIEPGKDADLVVWPADPLELTSYPDRVYIRGSAVSMESRQTLLRDRYLQDADGRPPAWRH